MHAYVYTSHLYCLMSKCTCCVRAVCGCIYFLSWFVYLCMHMRIFVITKKMWDWKTGDHARKLTFSTTRKYYLGTTETHAATHFHIRKHMLHHTLHKCLGSANWGTATHSVSRTAELTGSDEAQVLKRFANLHPKMALAYIWMYICTFIHTYICVCVNTCRCIYTYIYMYIYIYICVCM